MSRKRDYKGKEKTMRTFKFRAWDKKYGKYLGGKILLAPDGQLYEVVDDFHFPKINMDEVVVEQHTGLKDKNGKEIFEGDIVKTTSPDWSNFEAGVIAMQQQMYVIMNAPTYQDKRLSHCEPLGYYCGTEIEVIGNVHENQELLGGEE